MEALAQDLRAEICALLAQGPADLRGLDLVRADLSGLDLSGCDLRGQDLSQVLAQFPISSPRGCS